MSEKNSAGKSVIEPPDLYTVEGFEKLVRGLVDGPVMAEISDPDHSGLTPRAMVIGTKDPSTNLMTEYPNINLLSAPDDFNTSKDIFVAGIKALGEAVDAIAVAFFTEAWVAKYSGPEDMLAWKNKSLREHPDRKEMLMVHLEHLGYPSGVTRAWIAPIIESMVDGKKVRTLGPLETTLSDGSNSVQGRFTGMLTRHGHANKA